MRRPARRAGWLTAGSLGVGCWLAVVAGCTPIGAWVYSDPDLEVGRVRLTPDGGDRAIRPSRASLGAGTLQPSASVDVTLGFVVPRNGSRLWMAFQDRTASEPRMASA